MGICPECGEEIGTVQYICPSTEYGSYDGENYEFEENSETNFSYNDVRLECYHCNFEFDDEEHAQKWLEVDEEEWHACEDEGREYNHSYIVSRLRVSTKPVTNESRL